MRIKKDVTYKDIKGVRDIAGKEFRVDFELTPDQVDKRAMEGNMACLNFCYRRDDFLPDFNKKLYYGHITDEDGYDLGYVICEDELEEEIFEIKKQDHDDFVLYSWNDKTKEFFFLGQKIDYIHNPSEWNTYLNNIITANRKLKEENEKLKEELAIYRAMKDVKDINPNKNTSSAAAAAIAPPLLSKDELLKEINKQINDINIQVGVDYGVGYSQMGGRM